MSNPGPKEEPATFGARRDRHL